MTPLENHKKIALQFSGGKDSLACFFMLKPYWDKLTVYWVNTGASFPEVREIVEKISKLANLVEIETDQPENIKRFGYPVDVLPITSNMRMQSFMSCCIQNLMLPMHERMIADGITLVIRGQRQEERHKSPFMSGFVSDGIEYYFPIEDWTGDEVIAYLKSINELPEYYNHVDSSLDCWSCTAYLSENLRKRTYMRHKYPEKYLIVSQMLTDIAIETERDLKHLRAALEE